MDRNARHHASGEYEVKAFLMLLASVEVQYDHEGYLVNRLWYGTPHV